MIHIHENIQYLREKQNISLNKFSKITEISEDILASIEQGDSDPSLEELIKISETLNYPISRLLKENIREKEQFLKSQANQIQLLVLDVDGVLTDGGMYYSQSGDEYKKFNAKDGLAIKKVINAGKKVAFISSGINDVIIQNRAKLLGVTLVYVGQEEKEKIVEKWCAELNITYEQIAYIGDDDNDLAIMKKVGFSACPADAVTQIKEISDVILTRNGGNACVREFIDEYLFSNDD